MLRSILSRSFWLIKRKIEQRWTSFEVIYQLFFVRTFVEVFTFVEGIINTSFSRKCSSSVIPGYAIWAWHVFACFRSVVVCFKRLNYWDSYLLKIFWENCITRLNSRKLMFNWINISFKWTCQMLSSWISLSVIKISHIFDNFPDFKFIKFSFSF